jgi:preprotein translocase subunit SecE
LQAVPHPQRAAADEGEGELVATRTESPAARPSKGRGGVPTRFVRESVSEMRKVLWPSRSELVTYSLVVIVFVVIMVALVAGLDLGFAKLVVLAFG